MITYIGNGPYCYANSASMLLGSIGENIEPRLIEVLSGVGLGAFWLKDQGFLFLSGWATAPDIGISESFRLLSFQVQEESETEGTRLPVQALKELLENGPVMIGPLDMGELDYQPNADMRMGSDHYVLLLSIAKDQIIVHDPAGYPFACLGLEAFQRAWRADRIGYRRDFYRRWHSPVRIDQPSQDRLIGSSVKSFRKCYEGSREKRRADIEIGPEAIRMAASAVEKNELPKEGLLHLQYFTLALGARRAFDYEWFFRHSLSSLSKLKNKQAMILGHAHTMAVRMNRDQLSSDLKRLSEIEYEFECLIHDS